MPLHLEFTLIIEMCLLPFDSFSFIPHIQSHVLKTKKMKNKKYQLFSILIISALGLLFAMDHCCDLGTGLCSWSCPFKSMPYTVVSEIYLKHKFIHCISFFRTLHQVPIYYSIKSEFLKQDTGAYPTI